MIIEDPGVLLAATTAAERTYRAWEGDAAPDLHALWPALVDAVLLTIPNIPPRRADQ